MSQATLSTSPATFTRGSADPLLADFTAANANFTELYAASATATTAIATNATAIAAEATAARAAEALRALKVIPTYTVATIPAASANTGVLYRVSDGAAGSPCLALSDGTDWKVVATIGATIAAI